MRAALDDLDQNGFLVHWNSHRQALRVLPGPDEFRPQGRYHFGRAARADPGLALESMLHEAGHHHGYTHSGSFDAWDAEKCAELPPLEEEECGANADCNGGQTPQPVCTERLVPDSKSMLPFGAAIAPGSVVVQLPRARGTEKQIAAGCQFENHVIGHKAAGFQAIKSTLDDCPLAAVKDLPVPAVKFRGDSMTCSEAVVKTGKAPSGVRVFSCYWTSKPGG